MYVGVCMCGYACVCCIFTDLWQITYVIRIEKELLKGARVAKYLLGHLGQGTVALVHEFHLPVAAFEDWNALEHGCTCCCSCCCSVVVVVIVVATVALN